MIQIFAKNNHPINKKISKINVINNNNSNKITSNQNSKNSKISYKSYSINNYNCNIDKMIKNNLMGQQKNDKIKVNITQKSNINISISISKISNYRSKSNNILTNKKNQNKEKFSPPKIMVNLVSNNIMNLKINNFLEKY